MSEFEYDSYEHRWHDKDNRTLVNFGYQEEFHLWFFDQAKPNGDNLHHGDDGQIGQGKASSFKDALKSAKQFAERYNYHVLNWDEWES